MISRFRGWLFNPPYYGVPWLVWFYAFVVCMVSTQGGVFTGHLVGIDDPVRMTQVLEWIGGHDFYDHTIMRANPPEGFTTIWSRIVDIPIALVILAAEQFASQRTAALVAAVVIPFGELALLFVAARYFARPLVGKDKARLIVLFVMFTTILNYPYFTISGFHPGEASHRPWYAILDLLLLGAAGRIALGAGGPKASYVMAGATALLLAVGVEAFPVIAAACAILSAIAWHFNRPFVARRAMQAMLLGALGSLFLLPLHQPPSKLFDISFAEPSLMGPILLGTAALYLAAEIFLLRFHKIISLAGLLTTAAIMAAVLVAAFPQILDGPLAGLSVSERLMTLKEQYEARPLYEVVSNKITLAGMLAPTLIALIAGAIAVCGASNRRRRALYVAYFGFAAFTGAAAEWFSRYIQHAMTTACAWLLWAWERIKLRLPQNRYYPVAAFAVFFALGPLGMLVLPATQGNGPFLDEIFLYPAKFQTKHHNCDPIYLADYLDRHYGKDTVLNVPTWDGSMFLYYTDLRVDFIGLFPSHDKFIDNQNFFVTKNPDEAKDIARRHNFDLVAICRIPSVINPEVPMNRQSLMGLLQAKAPPRWLKRIETDTMGNYELYAVDKAALAQ